MLANVDKFGNVSNKLSNGIKKEMTDYYNVSKNYYEQLIYLKANLNSDMDIVCKELSELKNQTRTKLLSC